MAKTRLFYVLYSDKTWVFDQSESMKAPVYFKIALHVHVECNLDRKVRCRALFCMRAYQKYFKNV